MSVRCRRCSILNCDRFPTQNCFLKAKDSREILNDECEL